MTYRDRALADAYHDQVETYRLASATLDRIASQRYNASCQL